MKEEKNMEIEQEITENIVKQMQFTLSFIPVHLEYQRRTTQL